MNDVVEPLHSPLGASSMYRWRACPGSFRLAHSLPSAPGSRYAAAGTLAHRLLEQSARAGWRVVKRGAIGQEHTVEGHAIVVDDAMVDNVNFAIGYLRKLKVAAGWMQVEMPIRLDTYFEHPDWADLPVRLYGTLDAAALIARELEIVDYKSGSGIMVDPVENDQLMFYGAGALPLLPVMPRTVKMTILQPAAPEPVRSWTIDAIDVLMWVEEVLRPAVAAAIAVDAPLVPGEKQCRFCPAVASCPALYAGAMTAAQHEFTATGEVGTVEAISSVPLPADPAWVGQALDMVALAEIWTARLREHAMGMLQEGVDIPGWCLTPTRASRKWLLDEKMLVQTFESLGITDADIWRREVRTPAQLEKVLNKTRIGKKLWASHEMTSLVEARSSGVKLARSGRPDTGEFDEITE